MFRRRHFLFFLSLGLAGSLAATGVRAQVPGLLGEPSPGYAHSGLLDLSRLELRHSLSYSASTSSSSSVGNYSGGLWMSQLGYRISDPLRISAEVGAHFRTDQGSMFEDNQVFLHRLALDYRPSRHFQLNISYVNVPAEAAPAFGLVPGHALGFPSRDSLFGPPR